MVKELKKVTILEGNSGNKYQFSLWSFEEFDDIKGSFTGGGLYLFTKRYDDEGVFRHFYIYLGETENYFTRFDFHHKEQSIRLHDANCIGFYPMPNADEKECKAAEADLLANYDFPCNTVNN